MIKKFPITATNYSQGSSPQHGTRLELSLESQLVSYSPTALPFTNYRTIRTTVSVTIATNPPLKDQLKLSKFVQISVPPSNLTHLNLTAFGGPSARLQNMWPMFPILPTTWPTIPPSIVHGTLVDLVATKLTAPIVWSVIVQLQASKLFTIFISCTPASVVKHRPGTYEGLLLRLPPHLVVVPLILL